MGMNDSILQLSLIVSVFGLFLFAYVSEVFEPPLSKTGSVNPLSLGRVLRVQGNVSDVHVFKGGSVVLSLDDGSGKVRVYLSYAVAEAFPNISKVSRLEVVGEVDEYQGLLEIKPKKPNQVRVLSWRGKGG